MIARIAAICAEFPRYGYRRVTAQLRHEGQRIKHKRVARIMRERGRSVRLRRQTVRMSDGGCRETVFPNLARQFVRCGPNHLWVGDPSVIRTRTVFVFLVVVLDGWSRSWKGHWKTADRHPDTYITPTVAPSAPAMGWGIVAARQASFGRWARPETHTITRWSRVSLGHWCGKSSTGDASRDRAEARMAIFTWPEGRYNLHRCDSALGYLSPINCERKMLSSAA